MSLNLMKNNLTNHFSYEKVKRNAERWSKEKNPKDNFKGTKDRCCLECKSFWSKDESYGYCCKFKPSNIALHCSSWPRVRKNYSCDEFVKR